MKYFLIIPLMFISVYGYCGSAFSIDDNVQARDNAFTGTNTHAGTETFSDFNTSDDSMWKVIYSTSDIIGTSFSISGLEGDSDEEYCIVIVATNANNNAVTMHFNSDTTATNYSETQLSGGANYSYNNNEIGYFYSYGSLMHIRIWAKAGSYRLASTTAVRANSLTAFGDGSNNYGWLWTNTADEVTSITFTTANDTQIFSLKVYTRR